MFTDRDLTRWRTRFEKHHDEQGMALLARLEAAERALSIYWNSEGDVIAGENVLKEWRKAGGKNVY